MIHRHHATGTAAALMLLALGSSALAQTSLEDQKKQADIALVQAQTNAAVQAQTVAALAAAKQTTEGKATVTDGATTAEGLILADYALRKAALRLATDAKSALLGPQPVWIVIGAVPPSTTNWIAYDHQKTAIKDDLELAIRQWSTARKVGAAKPDERDGEFSAHVEGLVPEVAVAATVVSTVTSLLKTDYTIAGTKLTPGDAEVRAIVVGALAAQSIPVNAEALETPDDPKAIVDDLDTLRRGQYQAARNAYYGEYLDLLAKAKGDTKNLPEIQVAAGKSLLTALTNFDTFDRALFTPANGVLPASALAREKALHDRLAHQPILYVTSVKSNFTTVTKKSLFTGIQSKPASLRAVAMIEYSVVRKGQATSAGNAWFATPEVKFDDAAGYAGYGYVVAPPPARTGKPDDGLAN